MTRVTLVGAAGKMGGRVRGSLRSDNDYELSLVEADPAGRERLRAEGWTVADPDTAYADADLVVLAVPDAVVGDVAEDVVPRLKAGAILVCLDPAGAYAERLPRREDISCFITHPTHPPQFELLKEHDPRARDDYWGGGLAQQSLVNALVWGEESAYERGEALARRVFRPVLRSHRLTLEQMVLLEPAMAETVGITCCVVIKEAMDEAIRRGVPADAASDFMLGHVQLGLALVYEMLDWKLSAGAEQAVTDAMKILLQPDWKRVFDLDEVRGSVNRITGATA